MAFIHGKDGTFLIGAQLFKVTDYSVDWSVDLEDITHTGGNGAQVMLAGIERFDASVNFVYDTAAKPTVAPNMMKPGTAATFHFKPDGTDDFSASCICEKFSFKSGPKAGAVTVTVSVKSNSVITSPVS